MNKESELFQKIRDDMWSLLSDRYRTHRRAAESKTEDEFLHERSFWPAFTFEEVSYSAGGERERILVKFHDTDKPEITLGFKVDLVQSMNEWSKRVGGRNPREYPEMFAAELIWFMVCFIGIANFDGAVGTSEEPYWINDGSEIFGKLKNQPNMESFDSHH